jgi:hypothetical protein
VAQSDASSAAIARLRLRLHDRPPINFNWRGRFSRRPANLAAALFEQALEPVQVLG